VIKIPLKELPQSKEIDFTIIEKEAVKEGLRAVAERRVSIVACQKV